MRESPVATKGEKREPELFGPYEVYERIGVGGMATVHRAKKQGIEGFTREVALKRMLSHLADDDSFIQSFVREARLASQLQHANIIHIHDLGRDGRVYYIAMEYVRGWDLRKILKQTAYATGPMPLAMMLTIARQLCDALDYAHNLADESGEPLGLVHRDVSPSNLLVAADGHLKVIDFGIAKATANSLRTLSGRVKGKFAYMAPEAIRGKQLDRRTDIFSMGIVAHEMLTARPLFATKNQFDTIRRITQDEVSPPSTYNPACPPELDDIVMTALAKSPEERWQTAGAMHRALDSVAKRGGFQATNREIAEWIEWAFQQPLQSKRVEPTAPRPPRTPVKEPTLKSSSPVAPGDNLDSASVELVWGGRGSGKRDSRAGDSVEDSRESARSGAHPIPGGSGAHPMPSPGAGANANAGGNRAGSGVHRRPVAPASAAALYNQQAAQQTPGTRPDPSAQAAGQSTMLGVAPPPGSAWRASKPETGSQAIATPRSSSSQQPTSQPTSQPPPSQHLSSQQPVARQPSGVPGTGPVPRQSEARVRARADATGTAPVQVPGKDRAALQIVLVVVLCIAAAAGGYYAVITLFN
ncbi:serine/threonine protein kinase [Haliangium ochraceum DSM 14365]|uniref:Serine/threonine protein kinase n=1 Tax=Haliangium ochraceum (strain DSM 14365 / JCM 11303 / SMP-2) TaxID=502025 RepID=D0LYN4_HALO1|nr:serine/threonine protein kinase [Haliangium ochraceum DSM 14365]